MLVKTFGSAVYGVDAIQITVEVNVDKGLNFHLVGLPDSAVKESQMPVRQHRQRATCVEYRPYDPWINSESSKC
jgi:hypothetical protein